MGNRSRDPDRAGGPPFEATVPPGDAFQRGGLVALVALALAFLGRVLAQLVQVVAPTAKLPAFDQWQSGALPYPALLASQVAIIGAQWTVIARVRRERWRPSRRQALALATFGTAYFVFMTFRLVAGSTILRGSWFDAPLPSVFHIVLASFVVTMAFAGRPRRAVPALRPALDLVADTATYPAIMIGAVGLFIAALTIVPGPVAAYGAVAVATAAVLGSELVRPYRRDWRPDRATVAADAAFLALVQILLPTAVAALAVAALQLASPALGLGVGVPWPHHWPVVGQVALMLVAADGARYWLHRLSHSWQPLWRLHAVHHSPRRLYWLNVARFHPAEKALQLVVDSLPFVLIGVDELVLAGYFVFYAVNGFFQHSNCRVRLGPLNHLISGPELHRWHHSTVVAESSSNFGNNLIVWDVLFGTRFLPPDRVVADLGIEGGVASDA